ncbi:putative dihydrodipicolinate synthetase family protein [Phaeoacremonium minimum UCRPA7]|uniref:Putative dihydrodipicolinate synthetase family protein n=1 Tax=Phaeoacremonium minimum (strain UCR-PA7) TaxID=1286976 RepID=R8BCX6_PHAM7|nr:putative dihydrodipicolinate synthetase family protein [Phaeoacremonium minimum UCRPA7]EON97164.1 putative dihydrodipicolinate synthetase family protein [Phaeoacremonium minimum UCRPA7]
MGSVSATKAYPPGVHVPSLTWFTGAADQEIDWPLQKKHLEFLVKSGLHGIVLAGTNGEAITLSRAEKAKLVRLTREIAVQAGRPDLPITLGCGGGCTRDVIAETRMATEAGADYAIVLVPSYFHFAMNEDAIVAFFQELADASPLPILIYNFPGVVAGLDVNSDMLAVLGKHPNIVGVKLTCGGIAKVAKVRAAFEPEQFSALAGQSDWLVPALSVGGMGVVTGVANLYPKCCLQIYDLYLAGKTKEATAAQLKLAEMEWGFAKGGINGTKWVVAKLLGYPEESCHCRRPYPQYTDAKKQAWILDVVKPLGTDEKKL